MKMGIFDFGTDLHASNWTLRDAWRWFLDANPAPIQEPDDPETPEQVLRREAAELGVDVLDFRGRDRRQPHGFRDRCVVRDGKVISVGRREELQDGDKDFGIWGWFGGGENKPTRGRARGTLPVLKSTTTVLHTMDVVAKAPRCIGMPVQNCIADDGTIVLCHSIFAYMYSAHAANSFSDSIEISGKAGAIEEHQVEPARALLRYVIASKRRNLAELGHEGRNLYIMPHAFSHRSRVNDPQAKIWKLIGEWGIEELGLKLGPVVGSGKQPDWCPGVPSNRRSA